MVDRQSSGPTEDVRSMSSASCGNPHSAVNEVSSGPSEETPRADRVSSGLPEELDIMRDERTLKRSGKPPSAISLATSLCVSAVALVPPKLQAPAFDTERKSNRAKPYTYPSRGDPRYGRKCTWPDPAPLCPSSRDFVYDESRERLENEDEVPFATDVHWTKVHKRSG